MLSDKIEPKDRDFLAQEVEDNMAEDNEEATDTTNMRQQSVSHHFNMMHEGELGNVNDEESNQNDLFSMLGDVKSTPHPNNNR
jgi:hypothetical protein